jgi:hypothetical protein
MLRAFLRPERVLDVRETPDLLPILAAVAATTPGATRFTGAARLRIKESDRLRSMAEGIRAIGGSARELPDGLAVRCDGAPPGGTVDAAGDHRIAMAFAIAATRCRGPVSIRGAEAANKSYPTFFEDFQRLGGKVDGIQLRDDRLSSAYSASPTAPPSARWWTGCRPGRPWTWTGCAPSCGAARRETPPIPPGGRSPTSPKCSPGWWRGGLAARR